ncbi:MAG: hypothetical protein UHD09_01710 [Bifidobacterium sp.]|nr:hypothetical protein [Bifidobacterium sp.]
MNDMIFDSYPYMDESDMISSMMPDTESEVTAAPRLGSDGAGAKPSVPKTRKPRAPRPPITEPNDDLKTQLDDVHGKGRCLSASTTKERSLLHRYYKLGVLQRVGRGMYDDKSWNDKDTCGKSKAITLTLVHKRPSLVVTGPSACDFQGIQHASRLHGGRIYVVDSMHSYGPMRRSGIMTLVPLQDVEPVVPADHPDLKLTPPVVSVVWWSASWAMHSPRRCPSWTVPSKAASAFTS